MKEKIEILITELLDNSIAPGEQLDKGVEYDSSKTVAFKATKKIKDISEEYVPIIKEIVVSEKDKERKGVAYSILTSIAGRLKNPKIIDFLLTQLQNEKSKSFVGLKLISFYWSGVKLTDNVNIVLKFAEEKNNYVRHSAIQLLSLFSTERNKIEKFLIKVLKESKDDYDINYAHLTLKSIGSEQSVEHLKKSITKSRKSDTLITGISALGAIDGVNQVDFFLTLLADKKDSFVKSTLIEYLAEYSDSRAIEPMIDRVKQILSRKRKIDIHYGKGQKPELIHALQYLNKYDHLNPKIGELKKWILDTKISFLDETETKMIKDIIK